MITIPRAGGRYSGEEGSSLSRRSGLEPATGRECRGLGCITTSVAHTTSILVDFEKDPAKLTSEGSSSKL
jgi:hypothetical protein